ncbi:hypothetical protein ABLT15_29805 [Paraburkholderia tropica]|uniref:hypothetical protein n=1 Tax=Paraburkholderia tropica TaxID=92647 RepID=UPI001CAAD705|nr:hypothetical protein [Paraburkholderia tropica]CAG9207805.1 conserved hypothetical protein [Paraburkholderia tropica]
MTYSSNDFSEDIGRCLIDTDVVEAEVFSDADIGAQADLAIAGIIGASHAARAARFISTVLASPCARDDKTLADALRLADAIARQGKLVLPPAGKAFTGFVKGLPGGREWSKHVVLQPV